jgi:hypothetical protein
VGGVLAARIGGSRAAVIGLVCALPAVGCMWVAARFSSEGSVAIGMLTLLLPAVAAVFASALDRTRHSAAAAAISCAVVAGLLAFIVLATTTYATASGHPSAALAREFRRRGAVDYRSWLVSDNLGGAFFRLILLMPAVGLSLGLTLAMLVERQRLDPAAPPAP